MELLDFFRVKLAGVEVDCAARFKDTHRYFGDYCLGNSTKKDGAFATSAQRAFWLGLGKADDAGADFSMLAGGCGDALLTHDRCLIHAAAIRFRGRAWLFAAAPGVGKSTQVRTLMELYPGQFSVICGDRPILESRGDGTVLVHPSPWNGKEGWHGAEAAPLAGIFCLQRGEETSLEPLSPKKAVLPVFRTLIANFETEDTVRLAAALEERILLAAPVWRYVNGGVPDSSRFLYEHVFCEGGTL